MNELKPCSNCGSEGVIIPFWSAGGKKQYRPECSNEVCPVYIDIGFDTPEEAIEFWNKRPIEDALQAHIDDLEKFLIEIGTFKAGRLYVMYLTNGHIEEEDVTDLIILPKSED